MKNLLSKLRNSYTKFDLEHVLGALIILFIFLLWSAPASAYAAVAFFAAFKEVFIDGVLKFGTPRFRTFIASLIGGGVGLAWYYLAHKGLMGVYPEFF